MDCLKHPNGEMESCGEVISFSAAAAGAEAPRGFGETGSGFKPSFLPIGGSLCPAPPPITVRMRERGEGKMVTAAADDDDVRKCDRGDPCAAT